MNRLYLSVASAVILCTYLVCGQTPAPSGVCTGYPKMYNGKPCASTTRYWDGQKGACGCGTSDTDPFSWQWTKGTAAASAPIFGSGTWCGTGCGKCFKLTPTAVGASPLGRGAPNLASLVVKVTNLCPYSGNEAWCAYDVNSYGYEAHFDLMDYNMAGLISNMGWDNPEVTYEEVDCAANGFEDWNCQCKNYANSSAIATDAPTQGPTQAPATEAPTQAPTHAHVTEAPVTEAPVTEAPATEAPVTEAPATEAPATEAPTDAPATDAPTNAPTPAPHTHKPHKPHKPASTPSKAATSAPTAGPVIEAATTAPTNAPTTPTDAPTGVATDAAASSIRIQVNGGSNAWWLGFSVVGGVSGIAKIEITDNARALPGWTMMTYEGNPWWNMFSINPMGQQMRAPLSLRFTFYSGQVVIANDIITSFRASTIDTGVAL